MLIKRDRSPRILRSLEPPTRAVRMLHNTTHVPFRNSSPLLPGESREMFTALTSRGEHDVCHSPKVPDRQCGYSYHSFSLVVECVAPAPAVMRHQILLREHQLWHTLPQPLLYLHFMAACHMLQVASIWTYSVVVNNDLNVSVPAIVDIVLLVEALAAALGGHCGSSVCVQFTRCSLQLGQKDSQ